MLNQVIVVGRLVADPEVKKLESGKEVTNVTLAVSRPYKNAEGVYETDFVDCVKTRQKFALNEVNGHHSCTLVNMAAVALRLGRKDLKFDRQTQTFIGDDTANALINQPMRGPWKI